MQAAWNCCLLPQPPVLHESQSCSAPAQIEYLCPSLTLFRHLTVKGFGAVSSAGGLTCFAHMVCFRNGDASCHAAEPCYSFASEINVLPASFTLRHSSKYS